MYRDSKDGISIVLTHESTRKDENNLCLIKVRVTHKRKSKFYTTGKKVTVEDWDKPPTSKSPELVKIRNSVKNSFNVVAEAVEELTSNGYFTFETLNIRLGRESGGTLNGAIRAKIEELKQSNQIGSMNYYHGILRSIETYAGREVEFNSVTVEWLRKFESYLVNKGNKYSSIGMRMRGIRAMMTNAKKDGLIKEQQYPFGRGRYEIKTSETIKKALTIEQISQISNFSDGNLENDRYRDIWLFMYLCNGINCADLVNLKFKNIIDGEICFVREKTKRTSRVIKEIRVILTSEMYAILNKWGNPPSPDNYLFSLIKSIDDPIQHSKEVKDVTKKINKRTKNIGKILGIGNITTYTARHSFATVLKRSGANLSYISESLGHSDLKTTESYLASFEKDERTKNANLLTQYKKV